MARLATFVLIFFAGAVVYTYPNFTANDKFVGFAILLFVGLFLLTLFYFKQQLLVRNLLLLIFGMSGFAFLLVPLYDVLCDVTGLNGKMDLSVMAATPRGIDQSRTITVEFVVSHNQQMPWEFKPKHTVLQVHPGEMATTAYYAKNLTGHTMIAQAIPSIAPSKVSKYFKKVECFCFSNQKLGPGESAYLGLRFYLDPDFPADVQRVTLAYTIFDISDETKEWLCQNHSIITYHI